MKKNNEGKFLRTFSEELKRKIVSDLVQGKVAVAAVCSEYSVSKTSVYRWISKYSPLAQRGVKVVLEVDSAGYRTKELEKRLKEAEAALGRKQMEVDFLEKMIEIAREEYGIDVKKNSSTPLSTGSGASKGKGASK